MTTRPPWDELTMGRDPRDPKNAMDAGTPYGPQNSYSHMLNWLLHQRDTNLAAPQSTPDQFGATDYGANPNWHEGMPNGMHPLGQGGFEVTNGNAYTDFNNRDTALQFMRALTIANRIRGTHPQSGANLQTVPTPSGPVPHFTPHELSDAQLMSSRQAGTNAVQQQQKDAALKALLTMRDKANAARRGGGRNF